MPLNTYYHRDLDKLFSFLIPHGCKALIIDTKFTHIKRSYDYIVLKNIVGDVEDVRELFDKVHKISHQKSRIIVTYYNHLWYPLLKLASIFGWRQIRHEQNWLDDLDLINLLDLADFELITHQRKLLIPIYIPIISAFINSWIAPLPIINSLCLTTYLIARPKPKKRKEYSVSIIIPARNEEGNIPHLIDIIPSFGKWQEFIFVEGHSSDDTWNEINKIVKKTKNSYIYKQKGFGKANAVRLGFSKAKGEILMIFDADLTVDPKELKQFYEVMANGKAEFTNGSRLVYPMEKEAMRTLNKLGNKIFSILFTWILGQRFKDTLCGTKALFRNDYQNIEKNRKFFGEFDPFGDFDLIFGAVKQNLKIREIPVRYKQRKYGYSNISRFKNCIQLFQMTLYAFRIFKTYSYKQ